MQNKKKILIIVATIVLAGIALFTVWRLYQLRREAIAPTAPKKVPAQEPAPSCTIEFNIAALPTTPTPSPSVSPTPSPSASSKTSPTPTPSPSPSSAPGVTPSPTPAAGAVASPQAKAQSSPSPAAKETLPVAGVNIPTGVGIMGGIMLLLLGLALAL